jgi:hypothetical protein
MKSKTARARRRKVYQRATAIARDVRTADFPDAVDIIAKLIAGPMARKHRENKVRLSSPDVDAMPPAERELWRRANPNLAIAISVDALERKLSEELDLPPDRKVEFRTEPLQPSTDIVMVEGRIPVSAPLARELVADGTLVTRTAIGVDGQVRDERSASCDRDCPRRRASWPGCCKLDRVEMSDVFEHAGPDSFGGEDGMHSPAAATIREQIEQDRARHQDAGPARWKCKQCGEARRRSECLVCGNQEPITDEERVSGLVR